MAKVRIGPGGQSLAVASLALAAALGCGTDVSIRFISGTVSETASCDGRDGRFPLRQSDGLTVVVIVTDETTIVRAGTSFRAGCDDIVAGDGASVRGSDDQGDIRADEVELFD
jgi:hypothetical protein